MPKDIGRSQHCCFLQLSNRRFCKHVKVVCQISWNSTKSRMLHARQLFFDQTLWIFLSESLCSAAFEVLFPSAQPTPNVVIFSGTSVSVNRRIVSVCHVLHSCWLQLYSHSNFSSTFFQHFSLCEGPLSSCSTVIYFSCRCSSISRLLLCCVMFGERLHTSTWNVFHYFFCFLQMQHLLF